MRMEVFVGSACKRINCRDTAGITHTMIVRRAWCWWSWLAWIWRLFGCSDLVFYSFRGYLRCQEGFVRSRGRLVSLLSEEDFFSVNESVSCMACLAAEADDS